MTTKQMLFSALILGANTGIIAAAEIQWEKINKQSKNHWDLNDKLLDAIQFKTAKEVEQLLKQGAWISRFDNEALYQAIKRNDEEGFKITSILIENDANINDKCDHGYTAAHIAVWNYNPKVLHLIHEKGGNLTIKDDKKKEPSDYLQALDKSHPNYQEVIAFFEELQNNQK